MFSVIPDIKKLQSELGVQFTKTTNRWRLSPGLQAEREHSGHDNEVFVRFRGASRRALVYGFPSSLHLTLRLTAFLSPLFPTPRSAAQDRTNSDVKVGLNASHRGGNFVHLSVSSSKRGANDAKTREDRSQNTNT